MESRRKAGATIWQQAPPPHSARTKEQRVPPPGPVWPGFRQGPSEGSGLGGRRPLRAGPLFSRRKAASCLPAAASINPAADSASAAAAHKGHGRPVLRLSRARRPAAGPTHLLPAGRPGSGLVRLAGPAPTAGPCRGPRPCRRGARPATLARRLGPRARVPAARRSSPHCSSPLLGRHGQDSRGQGFLGGPEAEEGRPARLRLRPPFCTTRQEAARGGGHLRGLRSAAAETPLTFTENSAAAAAAASSGSGRRGRGREGEGNGKQKRGREGGGRRRGRPETLSSEESLLQPPPGTRRHLHRVRLAAGSEACLKPNLSLRGGRPTRVFPSGSFAIQSAAGLPSATNPRRAAGRSHRASSVAAQPRRSAQRHIREGSGAEPVA